MAQRTVTSSLSINPGHPQGGDDREGVVGIVTRIEILLDENKELEKNIDLSVAKKKRNFSKISDLIKKVKIVSQRPIEETVDAQVQGEHVQNSSDENPVKNMEEEEKSLVRTINESSKNLLDHENVLLGQEKKGGRDAEWEEQLENVKKYRVQNMIYKEAMEKRLEDIRQTLGRRLGIQAGDAQTSIRQQDDVVSTTSSTSSKGKSSCSTRSRIASKRKLNESVIECEVILKKISAKEKAAMVPKVLKVEEISPPNPYVCNFCDQGFTSAAPLVTHLQKHTSSQTVDCPFQPCRFAARQEILTNHVRSKHTKEMIFICASCPRRFITMCAKNAHERKHNQPEWSQCRQAGCFRFYQVAKGGCRCDE